MKNIILVPTDFSEVCENALNQASAAAKYLKHSVAILHVIDKNTKAQLKKDGHDADYIDTKLQKLAVEINTNFDIDVAVYTKEGDIFTAISEVATDIGANLIYLGTHGKVGMQKLTGSFALKVVVSSPVPVVVVQKRPFEEGYKKIVLPITSDAGPWEKTRWATFIAKNFNAEIDILQLDNPALSDAVNIITGHFDKEGVAYKVTKAKSGNFSKMVIDYATTNVCDMIMIMTNPDKSYSKFILGSYDEEMIFNTSQIPVMCINPRKYNWEKIFKI